MQLYLVFFNSQNVHNSKSISISLSFKLKSDLRDIANWLAWLLHFDLRDCYIKMHIKWNIMWLYWNIGLLKYITGLA